MIVCYVSPSGVGGRFIVTTGITGGDNGSGTTNFGTFLFHTVSSGTLVAFGNWNLLRRL